MAVACGIFIIILWSIIMQFYNNSTELSSTRKELQQSQSFFASLQQENSAIPNSVFFFYYHNYYQQFCTLSNQLNNELVVNNSLIELKSSALTAQQPCLEAVASEGQKGTGLSSKNTSQIEEGPDSKLNKIKLPKKKAINRDEDESNSYQPDDDYSKDIAIAQASQSKNVPKNYGKAIVIFIQRHEAFTKRVLARFNINQKEFLKTLEKAKRSLNTIRQLRSLWLDEENPFAKAYRVFTIEYLRKHSLSYIFNSRVENFNKHIKYRFKMVESVKDPRNFTHMKDF